MEDPLWKKGFRFPKEVYAYLHDHTINWPQAAVLSVIFHFLKNDRECYITDRAIGERTCMSPRGVRYHIESLKKLGLIEALMGKRRLLVAGPYVKLEKNHENHKNNGDYM